MLFADLIFRLEADHFLRTGVTDLFKRGTSLSEALGAMPPFPLNLELIRPIAMNCSRLVKLEVPRLSL